MSQDLDSSNFAKTSRVDCLNSDFGVPSSAIRDGTRKRSPDRRGLLRLSSQHKSGCPLSSEATTLSSSRDILASRHKIDRGRFYRGATPSFGCNPSECLNAPSTIIPDNDLYRDILLPSSSDDKVKTECIDDLPLSPTTTPSIPYVSDVNDLIDCPLHRRLVKPTVYLRNPWSTRSDSKPDLFLDGSAANRSDPVVTPAISCSKEISAAVTPSKFSDSLYSTAICFPCEHTPVQHPLNVIGALGLYSPPPHLKFCQISNRYSISNSVKAAEKAAPFSPSASPHYALVTNATVVPKNHSTLTAQALAAVSSCLLPTVDFSLGWVMGRGASRH